MNLLEHDVESFFFGCVRVEHLKDGIRPRRMTSKQQRWFGEQAEGYGIRARSPMAAYPTQLGRLMAMEVLNQGVGGHIFETSWLDTELSFRPELITIAYGTNDWSRGLDRNRIRSNVQAFMIRLREVFPANESSIVVLSPIWRSDFNTVRQGGNLREFSRVIMETAAEFGDTYAVDGTRLLPNQDWYVEDGVHPNDVGFLYYATRLYQEIRSLAV